MSASVNDERINFTYAIPSSNLSTWVKGFSIRQVSMGLPLVVGFFFWFVFCFVGVFWIGGQDLLTVAYGLYPDPRQVPSIGGRIKILRQTAVPHMNLKEMSIFQKR